LGLTLNSEKKNDKQICRKKGGGGSKKKDWNAKRVNKGIEKIEENHIKWRQMVLQNREIVARKNIKSKGT